MNETMHPRPSWMLHPGKAEFAAEVRAAQRPQSVSGAVVPLVLSDAVRPVALEALASLTTLGGGSRG